MPIFQSDSPVEGRSNHITIEIGVRIERKLEVDGVLVSGINQTFRRFVLSVSIVVVDGSQVEQEQGDDCHSGQVDREEVRHFVNFSEDLKINNKGQVQHRMFCMKVK